ncbi:MAG: AI-2E family transporter [Caldilineaceae bacterium]
MDVFQNNSLINTMSYSLMRSGLALQRQFDIFIPVLSLPAQFRAFTDMADQTIKEQAVPFASNAFYVLGQIVLAVVISVYWLTARRRALRNLLRATPRQYQPTISHIWIDTEEMLGGYFRGQIILGLAVGTASLVGLLVLRVPNALPLAVIAGLLELVPFVGPIGAAIPAVLMGLTVSPLIALLVGLLYVVIQQVEGNYLVPRIMSSSVSLHPLIVLIAIFAGFQLNGVVGALPGRALAGIMQIVLRHLPAAADSPEEEPT